MILAYGQDDRVCAYTSLVAMLEVEAPAQTTCCFLCDKEEIGSVGATGARSYFFENTVAEVLDRCGCTHPLALRRCLAKDVYKRQDHTHPSLRLSLPHTLPNRPQKLC